MLKRNLLVVLALAAALGAQVPQAGARSEARRTYYYLTAGQRQFAEFQPPPAAGSKEDLADLAALRDWQAKRTEGECARANSEATASYSELFGGLNPFPTPLPDDVAAVLARVKSETDGVVGGIKYKFKKQRPFRRDSGLKPCLGRIGGLAYPSGHATIARVFALLLSDLVPERRAQFLARADEAALDRVIGGVHHPSDIEAGKKLADSLYSMYLKSPAFQSDMKTLRDLLALEPAAAAK